MIHYPDVRTILCASMQCLGAANLLSKQCEHSMNCVSLSKTNITWTAVLLEEKSGIPQTGVTPSQSINPFATSAGRTFILRFCNWVA